MSDRNLSEIDRALINLLKERISLLSEGEFPSIEQQISQLKPVLKEAGLPEIVWENVVTSCAATLATYASIPLKQVSKKVTIVGGRGMMGQFFKEQLINAGHQVNTLGSKDWDQAEQILGEADFVLICVPIERTIEIIQKTAKFISPSTVLADITSIKSPFLKAMLESHQGPVLGLHPMFGPGVKSFLSQTVVACPGRGAEEFQWFLELVKNEGSHLIVCPAEEHDKMMIAVQAIRHFSTFSLGVFLAEDGFDIPRSLKFASPIYRIGIDMVTRLFAQDAGLYADIMLATDDRTTAIKRLAVTIDRLANLVTEKNRDALIQEFEKTRHVFGEEANRAMRESSHVINALSTIMAAYEVEERKN